VRISTIPGGQMSVVLLSHDVDWENSFTPALSFAKAEAEASLQTRSTFFIQTKYVSDANSHVFFFGKNLADIRGLFSHSIGSHSFIHSRGFNKFELGTGGEEYPVLSAARNRI
jgi:hypothetical protein